MNIPNILSASRLLLAPVIFYLLISYFRFSFFILLIIIGLTDFFDGYISRKFNQETKIGIFLDSIADKFLILLILGGLIIAYDLKIYQAVLMLTREIVAITGRVFLYFKVKDVDIIKDIPVTYLGKITTFIQLAVSIFIVFGIYREFCIIIAIVFSIFTGIQYFFICYEFTYKKSRV